MVKQSNKQTTKVIVKIGTDVVKRKRTYKRKTKSKKEEQVQPRPVPQSFGTLSSQNTALNSFSSNIQNSLSNILKSQSDLNAVVNQLRAQQQPEENESQNAQIVSNLNLDNDRPIDYQALLQPALLQPDGKEEFTDYSEMGIPPKGKPFPEAPELQEPPASASSSKYFRRNRQEREEEYQALTEEEKQRVNDYYFNLEEEAKKAVKKPKQRGRSKVRKDDPSPFSKQLAQVLEPYENQ